MIGGQGEGAQRGLAGRLDVLRFALLGELEEVGPRQVGERGRELRVAGDDLLEQRNRGLERLRPIVVLEQIAGSPVVLLPLGRRCLLRRPRRERRPYLREGEQQGRRRGDDRRQHPGAKAARLRGRRAGQRPRAHADRFGQRGGHLPGARETPPGVGVDGGLDRVRQRLRQIGPRVEQGPSGASGVRRAELLEIRALDGVPRRQQVEQQDADGVDVGRDRRRLSAHELGCHVGGRAAGMGKGPAFVGEPEVHQQDPAALLAHDVAGLDVAVDESRGMHRSHRPADVDPDERGFPRAQGTLTAQELQERLALDEVAPEPDPPIVLVHAVDRHDVGVSDARHRPRFGEHASLGLPGEPAGEEELEGDVALERRVEGTVDLAERASSHSPQVLEWPPAIQVPRRGTGGGRGLELGLVHPVYRNSTVPQV